MSERPTRFQRSRRKGAKLPKGCVFVGRPSRWGNPWRVDALKRELAMRYDFSGNASDGLWRAFFLTKMPPERRSRVFGMDTIARRAAVDLFRNLALLFAADDPPAFRAWLDPLRGRHLACWCRRSQPCHADVLLELANPRLFP